MADETDQALIEPIGFTEETLGLSLYGWQDAALAPLELATGPNAKRQNIAVAAPNGAGKDERIIAPATFYWLTNFKRGKVVITTKSDLQLMQQTIPQLERHRGKFEGYTKVETPRYELSTPTGGRCVAFVSKEAGRVEGWHKEDNIDGPLLLILNEVKSLDDKIVEALLARCTPNAIIAVSSTGEKRGWFFKIFSEYRSQWRCVQVGLKDCPHIEKERIDFVINTWGIDHPVTRSTLFGEFMDQEEVDKFVISYLSLMGLLESPPEHVKGIQIAFCDFADGGAENVVAWRDGNKIEIFDAWREPNKLASVARFINAFKKLEKKWRGRPQDFPQAIWGDAADKEMCDLLAEAGWKIQRQNFGAPPSDETYLSWGAEAWRELSVGIEKRDWILPKDDKFIEQATTRYRTFGRAGKLGIEEKYAMKKRGLVSPDRVDAVAGAANVRDWAQSAAGRLLNRFNNRDAEAEEMNHRDSKFLEGIGADAGG